mmetsp:Transcript_20656/g.22898  ORF Transcript_20656/g.22898 Transcript_20656/m.22898 type:complete len:288 (+) Transcript_20656:87-950(+)
MELNERQEEQKQEEEQEENEKDDAGQTDRVPVQVQEEEGVDMLLSPSTSSAAEAAAAAVAVPSSSIAQSATTTATTMATSRTIEAEAEADVHRATDLFVATGPVTLIPTITTTKNDHVVHDEWNDDDCEIEVSTKEAGGGGEGEDADENNSPSVLVPTTTMDPEDFINNGFQYWQEARNEWCGNITTDGSTSAGDVSLPRHAIDVDVDEIIDVLFDPRWRGVPAVRPPLSGNNNPTSPSSVSTTQTQQSVAAELIIASQPPRFPQNVPLPQMIDVLVDLWEAKGLGV